jgi:hypothetical protein
MGADNLHIALLVAVETGLLPVGNSDVGERADFSQSRCSCWWRLQLPLMPHTPLHATRTR